MKILVVTSYNNGQVAPFVSEQVEGLRREGVKCDYFMLVGKGASGYLSNLKPLKEKIEKFNPDIIHAHYGLSGLLAKLKRKVPVVTTYHGSDTRGLRNRLLSTICSLLSRQNVFVSQRTHIPVARKKCHIIPCGVDTTLFVPRDKAESRSNLSLPQEQPLILFAGAYTDPVKNADLARAALRQVPNARLIELRGYSREQTAMLFSAVDLLLLTSLSEGSPQVVKEALACNCPIVSVDVGDVAWQTNGIDGCVIVPHNADIIAVAVKDCLTRGSRSMGRSRIFERGLDNNSVVKKIKNIYDKAKIHEHQSIVSKCSALTDTIECEETTARETITPLSGETEVLCITENNIDNLADEWDNLYAESPYSTVFQSRPFFKFMKTLHFWKPFGFAVKEDGKLQGVIIGFIQSEGGKIKRHFTRRAIVNGGPMLAKEITDVSLAALLNTCAKVLRRKAIYVETRNLKDYSNVGNAFKISQYKYCPHYNFLLKLDHELDSTHLFHSSIKRDLKTAYRQEVRIEQNPSIEDIREFYTLLHQLYSSRVKTPLFPWKFFEEAYRCPLFHYTIVKTPQGRVIAGMLIAITHGRSGHEWFIAHDPSAQKNLYPSAVAYDAAINYCYTNGLPLFDFMGAGRPNDGGYGVRDYKAKFGGELVEQGRFLRILNYPLYALGYFGVKIIRRSGRNRRFTNSLR